MADDMNKNKQQGGQYGQGQGQQGQSQQGQPGQKSGQTGQSGQQQGNVDPNKKNSSLDDEQEDRDRQRRAS